MAEPPSPRRPRGGAPEKGAPLAVVVGRWLLLAVAAAVAAGGFLGARAHDRAVLASTELYVCPMHPDVRSPAPGDCPICNMALVRVGATEQSAAGVAAEAQVIATAEERIVSRQMRAAASVGADGNGVAVLYKDDLVGLAPEEPAHFFGMESRNVPEDALLITTEQAPADASTVNVRFRLAHPVDRSSGGARPVEVGTLRLDVRARRLLVVPTSAVLYSKAGPYVLIPSDQGAGVTKRPIEVGRILDSGYVATLSGTHEGATVVLAGLQRGERVISGYTFLVDVERRLREPTARMEEAMR